MIQMITRNCNQCQSSFVGEGEICNACKTFNAKDVDDITKLSGAIEVLALLMGMKELDK